MSKIEHFPFLKLSGWLHRNKNDIFLIGFLIALCVSMLLPNFIGPHEWLIGWDNINPEFDLMLHVKRAIFSVWQEYQGMGLLAGMGHAADLPRLIILLIFSIFVPIHYLRFVWIGLMLISGTVGIYVLLQKKVLPSIFPKVNAQMGRLAALTGSVFLLTNFATRQTFYTPFEPFVTHFGYLSWLIFTILLILEHPTKKRIFWFLIFSILSVPQAYVQTIFIAYLLVISIIVVGAFIQKRSMQTLKRIAFIYIATCCINAFWLLPTTYFLKTSSQVTVNAKINQMATEEAYLKNLIYGTLENTIQLKGFWFDTFDFDPQRSTLTPLLGYWRTFSDSPLVKTVVYGLFSLTILGVIKILTTKPRSSAWIVGVFLAGVTLLTIDTPFFTWINGLLDHIPLFHQAFRLRFTKISTITSLGYSLLFSIGFLWLSVGLSKVPRWIREILGALVIIAFLLLSFPVWQGELFYTGVQVTIPTDYQKLFDYFKSQPNARIMNLPQHTYWGWTYYRFGYIGWGFPWYGIEQPMADRAFDVWSPYNENYYWELSRALYSKDIHAIENVIEKYDIQFVLLDENVVTPSNNRSLFIDQIKELLSQIPILKHTKTFGNLTIYEHMPPTSTSFISIKQNLPYVSTRYTWTDNDVAFRDLGSYITKQRNEHDNATVYPFRSLFTKRSVDEREFTIQESDTTIQISSTNIATSTSVLKTFSEVYDSTKSADLVASKVKECGVLQHEGGTTTNSIESGISILRFESTNQRKCLSFDIPELSHKNGYLVAAESRHITGRPLTFSLINDTARHVEVETFLPTNTTLKTSYFLLPPLASDGLGYSFYIANDSIGKYETINELGRIRIYQIPYHDLVNLHTFKGPTLQGNSNTNFSVSHPNPVYYKINLQPATYNLPSTLVLSQSFHPGWIALTTTTEFPFIKTLNDHVLVNNWENGWIINPGTNDTIYIFFWPQLLEWLGFALLPFPFLWIALGKNMNK